VRVLFDTNVLLDILLEREPYIEVASKLFSLVDNGRIKGSICATAVTTAYYMTAKGLGSKRAHDQVRTLLSMFEVATVDGGVLQRALDSGLSDYEDSVAHEAANAAGIGAIVTRNAQGFTRATIPVFEPHELLAAIASRRD